MTPFFLTKDFKSEDPGLYHLWPTNYSNILLVLDTEGEKTLNDIWSFMDRFS